MVCLFSLVFCLPWIMIELRWIGSLGLFAGKAL